MHIHIDTLGGMAGDMFCAALLDAFPHYFTELQAALSALQAPPDITVEVRAHDGLVRGQRFFVQGAENQSGAHAHTHYRDICTLLDQAPLAVPVRARAQAIFQVLAEAEAYVHRLEMADVSFHEVGNWDSIIDIVSAAFLLERIGVDSASVPPLPLGGGRVQTAHGLLPVPAPATARLLQGFSMRDDGIGGERITPTGAAILKALKPVSRVPGGLFLYADGTGFGSRVLGGGLPNCVRVLMFEASARVEEGNDTVLVLRFDIDDQNPEDLAVALDHLRAHRGVLSVVSTHATGKHGRAVQQLEVLAHPSARDTLLDACFCETTTLGIRWRTEARRVLPRQLHQLEVDGNPVQVKSAHRPDGLSAKVENRDVAFANSYAQREALRQQGVRTVLTEIDK
jgi:pyridinium-3,5-bisthiocarboxylic acid mononucleotide nickel chelatase